MNSMPPSHLGSFLRRPDVVDNNAELCVVYSSYMETPAFLETVSPSCINDVLKWVPNTVAVIISVSSPQESLSAVVRRPTLPCVWPMALSSSKRSEVNRWFDRSLKNYLVFLTKSLISPEITYNSSCVAFQKLYVAQPRH